MDSFFKKFFFFCICLLIALCHYALADSANVYRATISDYCEFLNSTAVTDPHNLYDPKMAIDPPMIVRHGHPGTYRYTVSKNAYPYNPITYVNKMSQARFCNWKENNQDGAQSSNTETGVYDLTKMPNGIDGIDFSFSAAPNTTYSLSGSNNTLGVSDSMLGSAATYLMLNLVENSSSPNDNHGAVNGVVLEAVSLNNHDSSAGITDMGNGSYLQSEGNVVNPADFLMLSSPPSSDPSPSQNTNPIKISLVTVGDAGNQNDILPVSIFNNNIQAYQFIGNQYIGSVATVFQIGKYDIQAKEYCAYLNAVASIDDRYAVYDTNMASDSNVACITRVGATNPYSYQVIPGREAFPITYISYLRAVRFCNWVENGQPIGVEGPGTTETGSFNIIPISQTSIDPSNPYHRNWAGVIDGTNYITNTVFSFTPNANALWSIPTEDQWFKAAYYKPNTVGLDGFTNNDSMYYLYGTSSDDLPWNKTNTAAWMAQNSANYCLNGSYTMTSPPYLTPVGTFEKTKSPFGAYDMSGNVDQWTRFPDPDPKDTNPTVYEFPDSPYSVRGGSWQSKVSSMLPSDGGVPGTGEIGAQSGRRPMVANIHTNTIGFRLVYNAPSPPEGWGQFSENVPIRLGLRFWDCLKQTTSGLNPSNMKNDLANASMDLYPWVWGFIYPEAGKFALLKAINQFRRVPSLNEIKDLKTFADDRQLEKRVLENTLERAKLKTEAESEELERLLNIRTKRSLFGQDIKTELRKKTLLNGKTVESAGKKEFDEELEKRTSLQADRLKTAQAEQGLLSEDVEAATTQTAVAVGESAEAEEALAASVLFPPPLDVLVPTGIVLGGLFLAYHQSSVNGAETAFGIAIDGLKSFFW